MKKNKKKRKSMEEKKEEQRERIPMRRKEEVEAGKSQWEIQNVFNNNVAVLLLFQHRRKQLLDLGQPNRLFNRERECELSQRAWIINDQEVFL